MNVVVKSLTIASTHGQRTILKAGMVTPVNAVAIMVPCLPFLTLKITYLVLLAKVSMMVIAKSWTALMSSVVATLMLRVILVSLLATQVSADVTLFTEKNQPKFPLNRFK